ncbi:MAG TPA: ankyrin repeat domain-containing protein [Terriglobia bacterium]|nr:ankyrin repeat domain-containing protein [Terriglobia bacterium]
MRRLVRTILCTGLLAAVPVAQAQQKAATDVNKREVDGSTPLQWAVYRDNVAEAQRLLKAGANVSLANNYGVTAMTLASEIANPAMIKLLLDAGADANSANLDGQTALLAVARTGIVEAADLLIKAGAKVDSRDKFGGQTPLMWATARRHPKMMQFLISKGADVNARGTARDYQRHVQAEGRPKNLDSGGFTSLLYAARENCLECVKVLLAAGADIDLPDPDGVSPLLLSIMNANWDISKHLILSGADVNQWDIFGEAPLFTVLGNRNQAGGGKGGAYEPPNETTGTQIVHMLLERGANPNMQLFFRPANLNGVMNTRGSTPLIRAVASADMEMIKLLLEHKADATLSLADQQTTIIAAIAGRASENQAIEIVKMMKDAGVDINTVAQINHRYDSRGGTALHYAVRKRWKEMIKLLASYGINMNARDQDGLTALDYTQGRGYMAFMALQTPVYRDEAALLRELGATEMLSRNPDWPVLGPPQGVEEDIWPVGDSRSYPPFYTHASKGN